MKEIKRKAGRWLAWLLTFAMLAGMQVSVPVLAEEQAAPSGHKIVLTLGADLSEEQRSYVMQYFGISDGQVQTITITNADERSHLSGLLPDEVIGTRTISCALVSPTGAGGIQVKTANMNYVTGNMIATSLSTSGVINCDVLTVAPFEVSGTGALTGALMAYETAIGEELDAGKKALANKELVITGEIADDVGQDQATLVVNDIKIHIVRDSVETQEAVNQVVDEVIDTTEKAADEAAARLGKEPPKKLGEEQHQKLYDFGFEYSQMGYKYKDLQATLERVTRNVTKSTGIEDPITDTFTTTEEDSSLSLDSILLNTDDEVLGDDAIISATSTVAVGDQPAEPIDVYTGDVQLTNGGTVRAEQFIRDTNLVSFRGGTGSYCLMDLNGNILTDAVYMDYFYGRYGLIEATMNDGTGMQGVLDSDGAVVVPFTYPVVEIVSSNWAYGVNLEAAGDDDYDYSSGSDHYKISSVDVYYAGSGTAQPVGSLTRDQLDYMEASGDYLNIRDRSGAVTTHDPTFAVVGNPEGMYDYGDFDEDSSLADTLSEITGYSVYPFKGSYARASDYSSGSTLYGVLDRFGNIIVPFQFESIYYDGDRLIADGYFAAEQGENLVFVTQGGTVTGSFGVPYDDVYCGGMAARWQDADGSWHILAADGTDTNLGGTYENVRVLDNSKGLLWSAQIDYDSYDLYDWRGNKLLSGSSNYSLSSNGNYLLSQDGYTSNTLYLVNDAAPVKLSESAGGASEIEAKTQEIASAEAYTGDPVLQELGSVNGYGFASGTNLIITYGENGYGLETTTGEVLTEPVYYRYFDWKYGHLQGQLQESGLKGVLSADGQVLVPFEYEELKVLSENWAVGYHLEKGGSEADSDYHDSDGNYYLISQADVYHFGEEEVTWVSLTRDDIADIAADGDYLNVQNRSTGVVTTYDGTFTGIDTANYVSSFSNYSAKQVLMKQISDSIGYDVYNYNFPDGYELISDYTGDTSLYGIVDSDGNIILEPVFDHVLTYYNDLGSHYWANGYFCVEQDGKVGYATAGGTITCMTEYDRDSFFNAGMSGYAENTDGTYTIVSADGVLVTGLNDRPDGFGRGKFWEIDTDDGCVLVDWHGNVLLDGIYSAVGSDDGNFVQTRGDYNSPAVLYSVDGFQTEPVSGNGAGSGSEAAEESAPADTTEEVPAAEPAEEPAEEAPAEEAPAAEPAETPAEEAPAENAAVSGESAGGAAGKGARFRDESRQAGTGSAGGSSETPAASDTDASAAPETEAAQADAQSLLEQAAALAEADLAGNTAEIQSLLEEAAGQLQDSGAASVIDSALMLLSSGSTDAGSILTLIRTAQGM